MTDHKKMPLMHNQKNLEPSAAMAQAQEATHAANEPKNKKQPHEILFQNDETDHKPDVTDENQDQITLHIDTSKAENIELSKEELQEYQGLANELGLTNECAQKLFDYAVSKSQHFSNQQKNAAQNEQKETIKRAKEDQEFGGLKFDQSLQLAQNALQQLGNDELYGLLEEKGLGDHPEIIRLFYRIGQHMDEDNFHSGAGTQTQSTKSIADILYSS